MHRALSDSSNLPGGRLRCSSAHDLCNQSVIKTVEAAEKGVLVFRVYGGIHFPKSGPDGQAVGSKVSAAQPRAPQ